MEKRTSYPSPEQSHANEAILAFGTGVMIPNMDFVTGMQQQFIPAAKAGKRNFAKH